MAKIKVKLTDELISLIRNLNVVQLANKEDESDSVGIDKNVLYGGTNKYEQMALILGFTDKAIEGTEEDMYGTKYEKDTQLHMEEMDKYINNNLLYIEEIIHQFSDRGGLTPGMYVAKDYQHIWTRED